MGKNRYNNDTNNDTRARLAEKIVKTKKGHGGRICLRNRWFELESRRGVRVLWNTHVALLQSKNDAISTLHIY
jgi:hypothetical protein